MIDTLPTQLRGARPAARPSRAPSPILLRLWPSRHLLLPVLDFSTLFLVFLSVFCRWFALLRGDPAGVTDLLPLYLLSGAAFSSVWVLLTYILGGYDHGFLGTGSVLLRFRAVIYGGVHSAVALAVISFLIRGTMLSRGTILVSFVVGAILLCVFRAWGAGLDRRLSAR